MMTTTRTIIAIGLVVAFTLAACADGVSAPGPEATPTDTSSPTAALDATPTVEVIGGLEVRPLVTGDEIEIPAGVALLIQTGCTECDGPATGIERVYRDSSGELRRDILFYLPGVGSDPYISSMVVSQDGSSIALTVCAPGYCGGLSQVTSDARTSLRVSENGGETWSEVALFDGAYYARAVLQDGIVLYHLIESEDGALPAFELFPSGVAVVPPEEDAFPISLSDTELAWITPDRRWLRDDGSIIATLGEGYWAGWIQSGVIRSSPAGGGLALKFSEDDIVGSAFYLAVFGSDGQATKVFSGGGSTSVADWLPSGEAVGNALFPVAPLSPPPSFPPFEFARLPAIFDLETGLVRPIAGQFLENYGRNRVLAVVPAP